MVQLYELIIYTCIQALIPNPHTVSNLPAYQQMFILEGVENKCYIEFAEERKLACLEDRSYCE